MTIKEKLDFSGQGQMLWECENATSYFYPLGFHFADDACRGHGFNLLTPGQQDLD